MSVTWSHNPYLIQQIEGSVCKVKPRDRDKWVLTCVYMVVKINKIPIYPACQALYVPFSMREKTAASSYEDMRDTCVAIWLWKECAKRSGLFERALRWRRLIIAHLWPAGILCLKPRQNQKLAKDLVSCGYMNWCCIKRNNLNNDWYLKIKPLPNNKMINW